MTRATLKTPGLSIRWNMIGGSLYADVIHVDSGLPVRRFNKDQIEGGKHRFAARVDAAVSAFDWTRPALEISRDDAAYRALWSIRYRAERGQ